MKKEKQILPRGPRDTAHDGPPCGPREAGLQREAARGGEPARAGTYAKTPLSYRQFNSRSATLFLQTASMQISPSPYSPLQRSGPLVTRARRRGDDGIGWPR